METEEDICIDPAVDSRNVQSHYKGWSNSIIRADIADKAYPFAVLLVNTIYDVNIGAVIRAGNGLGASKIYTYGPKKKYNKIPAMGTYNYTPVEHLSNINSVLDLKWIYHFTALELTEKSISIHSYKWKPNTLMILGNESDGLPAELLQLADEIVEIPLVGSVRSLNLACSASIAMADYISKSRRGV